MRASSRRLSANSSACKRLEERRDALDARGAIDVGNGARQRQPVLDRIAGARRRLRAIVEHPPAPVGAAADIDGIEAQMRAARRLDADQRPQEFRIAGDQSRRQPAVARQRARTVGIRQHRFEQFGALDKAGLQLPPFAGLDDERDMAERPRPLDAGGILIDAIEHAGIAQIAVGSGEAAIDLVAAQRGEHGEERLPMRAHAPVAIHHLVENARQRPVAGNERLAARRLLVRRRCRVGWPWRIILPGIVTVGRRRSSVVGYSSDNSSGGTSIRPPVWP